MKAIFSFIFLMIVLNVNAQISFDVKSNKTELTTDEIFELVYEINVDGNIDKYEISEIEFPALDDFQFISQSMGTSYSSINGEVKSSKKFILFLRPLKKGKFKIKEAGIKINTNVLTTKELKIKVEKGTKKAEEKTNKEKPKGSIFI